MFDIYVLNLLVTFAMFVILIFRAWVEFKNFRIMWRETEWRKNCEIAGRILRAERDLFARVEGGQELYKLLCDMFEVEESEKRMNS